MQGEYRGDFTRDTFNPKEHFLRVLLQQGRVTLDADFNEQAAIFLHYLQGLANDLIGAHGGPKDNLGFEIKVDANNNVLNNLKIGRGRYYVDGLLCENDVPDVTYFKQNDYPLAENDQKFPVLPFLVYLDVWERHVSYIENDSIREVALGGPDTSTRAQLVWQVKITNKTPDGEDIPPTPIDSPDWRAWVDKKWPGWTGKWQPAKCGMLKARVKPQEASTDPCITSPESRYRGAENQLYRVEIHRPGKSWDGGLDADRKPAGNAKDAATFKWSRDNGSKNYPILRLAGKTAVLEQSGRDERLTLTKDDWVEILDDNRVLHGVTGSLVQVDGLDRVEMTVSLRTSAGLTYDHDSKSHPLLRKWQHKGGDPTAGEAQLGNDGALLIQEGKWLTLEDGVQIFFEPAEAGGDAHMYRTIDYWVIPARTATGDVEWPGSKDNPLSQPPHGVIHHYAPLVILGVGADGQPEVKSDLRFVIEPIVRPVA